MSRKSTDTKDRILNTTANLFSTHGFSGTSIDDILTAVGITKGAFYHYFKSKDHLCEIVLDVAVTQYHQLAEPIQEQAIFGKALHRWLEILIEKQTSGKWLYCQLITRLSIESGQLSPTAQNKLRTFWLWFHNLYENLIREALRENSSDSKIDPATAARLFISAHFGATWWIAALRLNKTSLSSAKHFSPKLLDNFAAEAG